MIKERHITTDAIILKSSNSGETNRIFTFISPDMGVVRATAYGAARIKSRFCSSIQNFVRARLFLYKNPKTNLYKLEDIADVDTYDIIKSDLNFIYTGSFFTELILNCYLSGEEYRNYFFLVLYSLDIIREKKDFKKAFLFFVCKFLFLSGYNFNLGACKKCRKIFDYYYFDTTDNGLFCENDARSKRYKIYEPAASTLRDFFEKKYIFLKEVEVADYIYKQILPLFEELIQNIFEKKIKTITLLKGMF